MKMRTLIAAACLVYLPMLSNANAIVSQDHQLTKKPISISHINHDHDLVIVYGGEDIRPKQLNTQFVI